MKTEQQLRVCLIGTGYMGKCHALAWNAVGLTFEDVPKPRLELLVEVNDQLATKRAEELAFAQERAIAHLAVGFLTLGLFIPVTAWPPSAPLLMRPGRWLSAIA